MLGIFVTPETKKQCKERGFRTHDKWIHRRRIPLRDTVGIVVKGETYFREEETEEVVSKTEARRRGLKPVAEHVAEVSGQVGQGAKSMSWLVYRISDCVPLQTRKKRPPEPVDLLAAMFAVNRSAKRYRDAARAHYHASQHGFAGHSSSRKRELYSLKERGIVAAFRAGRITCEGIHGKLAIYRGEGYCFHSPLLPDGISGATGHDDSPLMVEAKPRGRSESRLCDAIHTLSSLPKDRDGFRELDVPELQTAMRAIEEE